MENIRHPKEGHIHSHCVNLCFAISAPNNWRPTLSMFFGFNTHKGEYNCFAL